MSDTEIFASLEQELSRKGVVTFRLLSRKLSIHVNSAKNALAKFHSQRRIANVSATYWVSGIPRTSPETDVTMDIDYSQDQNKRNSIGSAQRTVVAVEEDLEDVKAMFAEIYSLHIYSLSTSQITSPQQLCGSSHEVLSIDKASGITKGQTLGKIIGSSTKMVGSSSSNPSTKPVKAPIKPEIKKPIVKAEPKIYPNETAIKPVKEKFLVSGKLDFSKAKVKDTKNKDSKSPATEKDTAPNTQEKRGIKRKSSMASEIKLEEPDNTVSLTSSRGPSRIATQKDQTVSVKKGVVVSDDESDEVIKKSKGKNIWKTSKRASPDSEVEPSIREMMDIDDSEVIRASRSVVADDQTQDEADDKSSNAGPEDTEMEDLDDLIPEPEPKPRKRKEKKSIPIGRNGYKKKRVVKSKTSFDDDGYMVTVDYSSYESVDEEEGEAELEKSRKKKGTLMGTQKKDTEVENNNTTQKGSQKPAVLPSQKARSKAKGKPSANANKGGQTGLASYFTSGGKSK
ncbi:dna polymerase subunit cdc27 [Pyrrhoderma noxium]|uniref:DNA polymerase delta subunit 3 n=1 Tax=Pyrrhoderma noxium TaxID=2282107 RepID=A0A286U9Q3_9AGAM|nr:dna polymerase subunit cdc27 [Pyrrhoderma noxium]